MARFRVNCIAAFACLLLTLGQVSSSWEKWPLRDSYGPRRHPMHRDDISASDWLYPSLEQNFHDISFDSNDWFSAFNRLFPDISKNIDIDESQFQIKVSMVGFTKEEVSVRVKDGFVVITGKHEPSSDDKAIVTGKEDVYKQFTYKYTLPEDTIVEEMKSRLTREGVLIVSAPRSGVKKVDAGYEVPVQTDEENAIPTSKKHNEFYDEDSTETTTPRAAEDLGGKDGSATPSNKPVITIVKDGDKIEYEFANV